MTIRKIPKKSAALYGLTATGALCAFIDASGLLAYFPLQMHGALKFAAQSFGTALGAAAPLPPFAAYNFFEDILAVHLAGGAALLTAGTALHYGLKFGRLALPAPRR